MRKSPRDAKVVNWPAPSNFRDWRGCNFIYPTRV